MSRSEVLVSTSLLEAKVSMVSVPDFQLVSVAHNAISSRFRIGNEPVAQHANSTPRVTDISFVRSDGVGQDAEMRTDTRAGGDWVRVPLCSVGRACLVGE